MTGFERVYLVVTTLGVIAALGVLFVYLVQTDVIKGQLDTIEAQLKLTQNLEQPNVLISKVEISNIEAGKKVVAVAHFTNTGRTVARNVHISLNADLVADKRITQQAFDAVRDKLDQGPFSIGPSAETVLAVAIPPVSKEDARDWFLVERLYLVVYGTIEYDGLADNERRKNKYLAEYFRWERPRPAIIPDFHYFNNLTEGKDTVLLN